LLGVPWLLSAALALLARRLEGQQQVLEAVQLQEQLPPQELKPGSEIGPYVIRDRLGEGSQAEVFLAEQKDGTRVAVKVLFRHICKDPEFRTRFEREVDAGMRLAHLRIIRVLRWSLLEGRYWMAQPYCARGSLADEIDGKPLPEQRCRQILTGLAEALAYAHQRKIVHRDMKPSNVLLDDQGLPVLADFGIARAGRYETITQQDCVLGTPAYIAPEQAQGYPVTPLCDLYSLGVLGYEMMTGRLPFEGEVVQMLIAHISEPPPTDRVFRFESHHYAAAGEGA